MEAAVTLVTLNDPELKAVLTTLLIVANGAYTFAELN